MKDLANEPLAPPTRLRRSFKSGTWEVEIAAASVPALEIHTDLGDQLAPEILSEDDGTIRVRFAVPPGLLGDGIQTLVLLEPTSGTVLDALQITAGEVPDDDMRAEMALLRAEIDLLKKAFRRHCAETS